MVDRPILFSAPMVRALLDGRKTQTRRVLKPIPWNKEGDAVDINIASAASYTHDADGGFYYAFEHPRGGPLTAHRARFAIGDRLWVRETWTHTGTGVWQTSDVAHARDGGVVYRATDDRPGAGWFPSIFMFRRHSRLTLIVTDVRVQRLQDISEADAMAEGSQEPSLRELGGELAQAAWSERQVFQRLWNHINGPGAWDANPWVVAISFRVVRGNIDSPDTPRAIGEGL